MNNALSYCMTPKVDGYLPMTSNAILLEAFLSKNPPNKARMDSIVADPDVPVFVASLIP